MSDFLIENDDGDESIDEGALGALLKRDLLQGVKELIDLIGAQAFANADAEYSDFGDLEQIELEQVDYEDDGDGNETRAVIEIKVDGESLGFVRILGMYSSWDSTEWYEDEIKIVEARQVVMTTYIATDGTEDSQYDSVLPKT